MQWSPNSSLSYILNTDICVFVCNFLCSYFDWFITVGFICMVVYVHCKWLVLITVILIRYFVDSFTIKYI